MAEPAQRKGSLCGWSVRVCFHVRPGDAAPPATNRHLPLLGQCMELKVLSGTNVAHQTLDPNCLQLSGLTARVCGWLSAIPRSRSQILAFHVGHLAGPSRQIGKAGLPGEQRRDVPLADSLLCYVSLHDMRDGLIVFWTFVKPPRNLSLTVALETQGLRFAEQQCPKSNSYTCCRYNHPHACTKQGIEWHMGVNHLGSLRRT